MIEWIEWHAEGIYLRALDLWLDPQTTKPAAWISHAHADHARGLHGTVLATNATLALYRMRWPAQPDVPQQLHTLKAGEPVAFRGARLTAYPAAHIRGAAQLLVEFAGERLVYTGDVKLRTPLSGAATEMPECDTLIIESTFGLPIYRFLEREQARERIVAFAKRCLAQRETPVFLGYALGRGQEIAHVLGEAGIPTVLHGAIARFAPLYEEWGTRIQGWRPYERGQTKDRAVVWLPGRVSQLDLRSARVAAVSGWAALHNARARYDAEELIPYSDHADFGELEELVRRSRARRVYTVHGYAAPLARLLTERLGVDARAAHGQTQRAPEEGAAEDPA
jgi:Cft2 family RNA processing exonuclease